MNQEPTSGIFKPRYPVLATDYDETLATLGRVTDSTFAALLRYRGAGGTLLLVTGRRLSDLRHVFPALYIFDGVVAENGAVLMLPRSAETTPLGPSPTFALLSALERHRVQPLEVGQVIISTDRLHERSVDKAIADCGESLHVILNNQSLMILPRDIEKGSGFLRLLERLGHSPRDVAGIGNAENDIDFLKLCGYPAAVANAVPGLEAVTRAVMRAPCGEGVEELIDWLLN